MVDNYSMAEDLDTKTEENVGGPTAFAVEKPMVAAENIERLLETSNLVRDYSDESPISVNTGKSTVDVETPRVLSSWSSQERKVVEKQETAQLYLPDRPETGTIIEVATPDAKTVFFQVVEPLAKITNPEDPSQKALLERRQKSVYIKRLFPGEPTTLKAIDTAKAENKYRPIVAERRDTDTKGSVLIGKPRE